jgi:hypothetical protein
MLTIRPTTEERTTMTTRARASQATGIEVGASSGPEGQRADRRARSVPVGRMPLAAGASMNPAAVLALPNRIDSMPTKVTGLGPAAAPGAGSYGSQNPIRFGQTDSTVPSTRVIGETITAGFRRRRTAGSISS